MSTYVVEFRLPHQGIEAGSPKEAAAMIRRKFEEETGLDLSNWYIRVFEYGPTEEDIGPKAEYFSSPGGTEFREVKQNIGKHEEIANGTD